MTSHLPWQHLKLLTFVNLVLSPDQSLLVSPYGSIQLLYVFETFYLFPMAKTSK